MQIGQAASFAPLALLAMREMGADGYVLYTYENGGSFPVRLCGEGLPVPCCERGGLAVARIPLRVQNREVGYIGFVFRGAAVPEGAAGTIESLARTLESIWSCSRVPKKS
jgi:hypothetical protein